MAEPRDDVELGEMEEDAFLPNQNGTQRTSKPDSVIIRWLPHPVKGFVKNLSRMRVSYSLDSRIVAGAVC